VIEYPNILREDKACQSLRKFASRSHAILKTFIVEQAMSESKCLVTVFYRECSGRRTISCDPHSGSVATYFKGEKNQKVLLEPVRRQRSPLRSTRSPNMSGRPNLLAWKTRKMCSKCHAGGDRDPAERGSSPYMLSDKRLPVAMSRHL